MEYLLHVDFLGINKLNYIDIILVYLVSLPILMGFSIYFAICRKYGLHYFSQIILFTLTLFSLLIFDYQINLVGSMGYKHLSLFIGIEIFLSMLLLIMWLMILVFASADRRRKALPGLYSKSHKKSGKRVFIVMLLTVVNSIYLYKSIY